MTEYIAWDYSCPGITFHLRRGRICILKQTLEAIGKPEYFHFLLSPEDKVFGIEPCSIDDDGAKELPEEDKDGYYEISSIKLIRYVYQICGWDKKLSYRVPGEVYKSDRPLVHFDLQKAYELHEGRIVETRKSLVEGSQFSKREV